MKKIGILGGISSASTVHYYKTLHDLYYKEFMDYYYPEMIIDSLNFQYFTDLENTNNMVDYQKYIIKSINNLKNAGANFVIMAANSPHSVFEDIYQQVDIPILSIVDAVARKAQKLGLKKLLLTGIIYTMQRNFYPKGMSKYDIQVVTPTLKEQEIIDNIIFNELAINKLSNTSKKKYLKIISGYNVDGVILGCTELPQLICKEDTNIFLLNSLEIHCEEAIQYALDNKRK